jgi:predicted O-methyltransferase YrrM
MRAREVAGRVLRRSGVHHVQWVRRAGRIAEVIPRRLYRPPALPDFELVEVLARSTNDVGRLPLWDGYRALETGRASTTSDRAPAEVRIDARSGRCFAHLARALQPRLIVEVGTAFGVSGMYWLIGLRGTDGHFLTFDPNEEWAGIARRNLQVIGGSYRSVKGTFEDNVAEITGPIDMAFLDAIHSDEHVSRQFELIAERGSPSAVVLVDDVNFASGDMARCWRHLSLDRRVVGSALLSGRVGVLELGTTR